MKIEDFNRIYEVVVFSSVFPQFEADLKLNNVVCIKGRLGRGADVNDIVIKLVGDNVWPIQRIPEVMTKALIIKIDPAALNDELIYKLKLGLTATSGRTRLFFEIPSENGSPFLLISNKIKLLVTRNVLSHLEKTVGLDHVKIEVNEL